jgi:hypothetical protein
MTASIMSSVGFGFSRSSAQAFKIMPGWQNPHCATSSSIQARWQG